MKSSDPKRVCYIETKNLDGETNLKERTADRLLTYKVQLKHPESIADLSGKITCDESND